MAKVTRNGDGVVLLRPGVGSQSFDLPANSTLADLLRAAEASSEDQVVFIDGKPIEESVPLQPGMVVTVVPRVRNAASNRTWQDVVGTIPDSPAFGEMVRAGRAIREADRAAARREARSARRKPSGR